MQCPKCESILVNSNYGYDEDESMKYTRFFCFWCATLFEEFSQSGDFIEENLKEMGEIKRC